MSVKTFVFILQLVTVAPVNSSCQDLRFRLSCFGCRLALRFLYIPLKVSSSSPESQVNKFHPLKWQKTFPFYNSDVCEKLNSVYSTTQSGRQIAFDTLNPLNTNHIRRYDTCGYFVQFFKISTFFNLLKTLILLIQQIRFKIIPPFARTTRFLLMLRKSFFDLLLFVTKRSIYSSYSIWIAFETFVEMYMYAYNMQITIVK